MKITQTTLTFSERRSINYQTVEVAESVTYELEPGDDADRVRREQLAALVRRVRFAADRGVARYEPK